MVPTAIECSSSSSNANSGSNLAGIGITGNVQPYLSRLLCLFLPLLHLLQLPLVSRLNFAVHGRKLILRGAPQCMHSDEGHSQSVLAQRAWHAQWHGASWCMRVQKPQRQLMPAQ
eukprot:scaffold84218_cov28-Tisochrysis_lutea.AAC.1